MVIISRFLFHATFAASVLAAAITDDPLPKVDLGYEIHQAASYNSSAQVYNFHSTRYATPPTGDLAFALPQAPVSNHGAVQNGSAGRNCYGAAPKWQTNAQAKLSKRAGNPAGQDCLFLDVYTPKTTFDKKGKASVIVWIHGGGSISGSKDVVPYGLMGRKKDQVVVVAVNYRLGAFGFLGGETLKASGGVSNLGLHDQRFAYQWVQKNIHLFGGDALKVTIMGESAGGGSVLYQVTAYGGTQKAPFVKAIPQSPSTLVATKCEADKTYKSFLAAAKCSNSDAKAALACLRKKSGDDLQKANQAVVSPAEYGFFGFGPSIDGNFIRDAAGVSLANRHFSKDVQVMTGYSSDEGSVFTDLKIKTDDDFHKFLVGALTSASKQTISEIETKIYPPPSKDTDYDNNLERADLVVSELRYTCATTYLAHAHNDQSYNYYFAVPPGYHGQDLMYTWYNGANPKIKEPGVADDLQNYIVSFAIDGKPVSPRKGQPAFPQYEKNTQVLKLNNGGEKVVSDPAANERCQYWQKATYLDGEKW